MYFTWLAIKFFLYKNLVHLFFNLQIIVSPENSLKLLCAGAYRIIAGVIIGNIFLRLRPYTTQ
jgi:hypothetical protein